MNVTLQKYGEAEHDITPFLDDEAEQAIDQALERRAFQRAVDDIELHCSNARNFFSDLFIGMAPTARWEIVVRGNSNRILFKGEIFNKSITFDVRQEWVTFEVYSCTKQFWDICKATRIAKAISEGGSALFITLASLVQREATLERMNGVIAGYRIDPLYYDRPIRFWNYTADSEIDNNGRYRDLDSRTTLDELFKAVSMYYNAEFFVDPETRELVMQKRGAIHNDVEHNLNEILIEEEEIDIQLFDEEKVDYVGLALKLASPAAPRVMHLNKNQEEGLTPGAYSWLATFLFRSGGVLIESPAGQASASIEAKRDEVSQTSNFSALIEVPLGPPGVTARNLYRTKNSGMGSYYQVLQIENNTDQLRTDSKPDSELGKKVHKYAPSGLVYLRYNEQTGVWEDPIVEDPAGLNRPVGEVFDVTPKLRFVSKPFGEGGAEIEFIGSATWRGETHTFIRTKTPHSLTENDKVVLSDTQCVPSIDGEHKVIGTTTSTDYFVDGIVPTTPGRGGVSVPLNHDDELESLEVAEETILDVFAFFGNETDLTKFQQQWIDMFLTKRKGRMAVKGIDFRIGDSVLLTRDFNKLTLGKGVIKKANNRLFAERTQLEVISV